MTKPYPLGVVFVLDLAALFVSRWVAVALSITAAAVALVWLVYLLNAYDFPWPWKQQR